MNKYLDIEGNLPTIHAEHDALIKLPFLNNSKKRLECINILVVRFLKTSELANSKPCINCINVMSKIGPEKGYKIKNIYYSSNNGTIIKTSLNKLKNDNDFHVSCFYRNKKDKKWYI